MGVAEGVGEAFFLCHFAIAGLSTKTNAKSTQINNKTTNRRYPLNILLPPFWSDDAVCLVPVVVAPLARRIHTEQINTSRRKTLQPERLQHLCIKPA